MKLVFVLVLLTPVCFAARKIRHDTVAEASQDGKTPDLFGLLKAIPSLFKLKDSVQKLAGAIVEVSNSPDLDKIRKKLTGGEILKIAKNMNRFAEITSESINSAGEMNIIKIIRVKTYVQRVADSFYGFADLLKNLLHGKSNDIDDSVSLQTGLLEFATKTNKLARVFGKCRGLGAFMFGMALNASGLQDALKKAHFSFDRFKIIDPDHSYKPVTEAIDGLLKSVRNLTKIF